VWRFHKYYIREILINLCVTFVTLFGVSLIALIPRGLAEGQGLRLLAAFEITLMFALDAIPHLLPISLLVAVVFTFGRAAADNEILALRGMGQSPLRLMGAVLCVGAAVSSLNEWLLHDMIPYVHFKKFHISTTLIGQFVMSNRPTKNRISFHNRIVMVWQKKQGDVYKDVTFGLRTKGAITYDGFARECRLSSDPTGRFLVIDLIDVEGYAIDRSGGKLHVKTRLESTLHMVIDLRNMLGFSHEGVKDTSTAQLLAELHTGTCPRPGLATWHVWWRTCHALAALLFALVGFPIGVLSKRSGRMSAFAFSFVPLAVYYGLNQFSPMLARQTGQAWPAVIPGVGVLALVLLLTHRAFRR